MPKCRNVKKAAAAQFQNCKMLQRAKKEKLVFGAVTKVLGAYFTVKIDSAAEVMATARGLFSRGTMQVRTGSIVVVEGTMRPAGDSRPPLPWEIVGVVDMNDAHDLVDDGHMAEEIIKFSAAAGAMDSEAYAADDIFDREEDGAVHVPDSRSLRDARKNVEHMNSVSSRVAALMGGRASGLDGSVKVGNLADPTLLADVEYDPSHMSAAELTQFKLWRADKYKPQNQTVLKPITQTVSAVMAGIAAEERSRKEAADQAAIIAQMQAAATVAEVREWFASRPVKENWDDEEEVDINTL